MRVMLFQKRTYGCFEIVRLVALGGMAKVFVARDKRTNTPVALKVLEGTADIVRFEREAHILASNVHPNIVRYVAHGVTTQEEPWLAMEWLDGEDLAARLVRGPLSIDDTLSLARGVARALAYAHCRGLTHRDLKPGNVFLVNGDVDQVKILDFGIARDLAEAEITAMGAIMGTPHYMPPEQAIDARRADARSDVFSLGALLYHCVTGQEPYAGKSLHEIFAHVVTAKMPRASDLAPHIPRRLDDLIAHMTTKDPADRPADGLEVLMDLSGISSANYLEDDSITRVRVAPAVVTTRAATG